MNATNFRANVMATRWGCLGAGKIASDFFTAIKENLPAEEHKFVAIAARDLNRAQKFANTFGFVKAYGSYDDLMNDPGVEIVYVATVNSNHAELSIKMMIAGKHVLCEKPMAMNLKQARKVFQAAKDNNVFFTEGLWSRFLPVYQQISQELSERSLGDIRLIQGEMYLPVYLSDERFRILEFGGGSLLSFGLYLVALACMIFREMPESITAVGQITPEGVDETVCILLKYKSGAIANLTSNMTLTGENTAVIYGDKGTIKIGSPMWTPNQVSTPSGDYDFPLKELQYNYPNGSNFQFEATAVRNYLKSGAKETKEIPYSDNEMIYTILDEVRRQIGVVFPDD